MVSELKIELELEIRIKAESDPKLRKKIVINCLLLQSDTGHIDIHIYHRKLYNFQVSVRDHNP